MEWRTEAVDHRFHVPVKRGLSHEPEHWAWGSCRYYAYGEARPALVNEQQSANMK
jgi:hypothetical protein